MPASAVTSITGAGVGQATLASSPNAFALKFTATTATSVHNGPDDQTVDGGSAGTIKGVLGTDGITFTIPNGTTSLHYTSGSQALADTFNTRDTAGLYKADLYLDDINPL